MRNFYTPHYEHHWLDSPRKINNRWRSDWYEKIGFEVNFEHLDFDRAAEFIKRGFAPAIPLNHGIKCGNDVANYIYPISYGDISDIPF